MAHVSVHTVVEFDHKLLQHGLELCFVVGLSGLLLRVTNESEHSILPFLARGTLKCLLVGGLDAKLTVL